MGDVDARRITIGVFESLIRCMTLLVVGNEHLLHEVVVVLLRGWLGFLCLAFAQPSVNQALSRLVNRRSAHHRPF